MSEGREIRINKVLRELNISLDRAVDFLKDKGHEIESSPNAKISQEEYKVLCGQFSADKGNKETVKVYDMNKKGEIVESEQKNTWRDPSDKNAPAGSNIHTPALPEPIKKDKKAKSPEQKIENKALKNKKRSNEEFYYQTVLKNNSKKKSKAKKKNKIKKIRK